MVFKPVMRARRCGRDFTAQSADAGLFLRGDIIGELSMRFGVDQAELVLQEALVNLFPTFTRCAVTSLIFPEATARFKRSLDRFLNGGRNTRFCFFEPGNYLDIPFLTAYVVGNTVRP